MTKALLGCLTALVLVAGATMAHAQTAPKFGCGGSPPQPPPTLTPTFSTSAGDRTNLGFECMMWQNFVYLNWPAARGQRGVPNKNAKFGAPAATVWETYKTAGESFPPGGRNPGPWDGLRLLTTLETGLAQRVASGAVRHLTMRSKISRAVLNNVAEHASVIPPDILRSITQAGGGTLYDLNGKPVYYEVAMNRDEYEYIVQNGLYNADTQATFGATNVIVLPDGPSKYGQLGALEVKAAWKILSDTERKSGRFHMVPAILPGSFVLVTVGLVGYHVFLPVSGQGVWATFAQVDNAPVQGQPVTGKSNFYDPNCTQDGKPCPVNVKDADPGQVVQVTPDEASTPQLNAYMQNLIRQADPKSPWQYYKIVNIQWPLNPVDVAKQAAPLNVPLPNGNPNSATVVNAVLETFKQQPGTGCLTCHIYGSVASSSSRGPNYATDYSFVFGHATSPPK
ncbi:MAG TPA: hypothetical protein VIJ67_01975 [Pseudolabrys sp.]